MELTMLIFLLLYIFKVFSNKRLTALSSFTWITAIISLQITMLSSLAFYNQLTPLGPVTSKITLTVSPFYREPFKNKGKVGTLEKAEAGESCARGLPGLHFEMLFQKTKFHQQKNVCELRVLALGAKPLGDR